MIKRTKEIRCCIECLNLRNWLKRSAWCDAVCNLVYESSFLAGNEDFFLIHDLERLRAFKNIHEVFYIYWTDYCYSLRLFTTRTKGKQTRKLLILLLRHFILRINNLFTFLFVKKGDKVETHFHWPIFYRPHIRI